MPGLVQSIVRLTRQVKKSNVDQVNHSMLNMSNSAKDMYSKQLVS